MTSLMLQLPMTTQADHTSIVEDQVFDDEFLAHFRTGGPGRIDQDLIEDRAARAVHSVDTLKLVK